MRGLEPKRNRPTSDAEAGFAESRSAVEIEAAEPRCGDGRSTPQAVTPAPLPRRMERSSRFADGLMVVVFDLD